MVTTQNDLENTAGTFGSAYGPGRRQQSPGRDLESG